MKVCTYCKIKQPYENFHRRGNGFQSLCKPCRKRYDQQFWEKKREKYLPKKYERRKQVRKDFANFKLAISCCVCGESSPECLDFHHTDPTKKTRTVSDVVGRSSTMRAVQKEMDKCVVLCANCHRKFHAGNLTLPTELDILIA